MSLQPPANPTTPLVPAQAEGSSSSLPVGLLTEADLEQLKKLPADVLDTIRSKLVQLIDAIATFRLQLESSPLTPLTLPYPTLISKFLILLNHTEALSQALNTIVPSKPINKFELPSARAEREEREKWEDGPANTSILGNIAVAPRGLEGLEDGKEWIVGVLTRTKLAPEIEKAEQKLLSLLPPPPSSDPAPTVDSLCKHVRNLTKLHEQHILNCRSALHKARYARADPMDIDPTSDDDGDQESESKYDWKMRVEVDDEISHKLATINQGERAPGDDPIIKGLLGFMRDGRNPKSQAADGISK
ncbi:hypothetical protein O181_087322 [Austropuccinia psidii MF-1]|uniref:Mediator of RNA polymerase II transcription subunit 8 n=1 Tax=Austropuccinia psidii MF-1 TaxID=1389203 RepID=A0A9Q3IPH1_9BASI|nr:hypothetical protein [Austropuccinia psidii MF-1]